MLKLVDEVVQSVLQNNRGNGNASCVVFLVYINEW